LNRERRGQAEGRKTMIRGRGVFGTGKTGKDKNANESYPWQGWGKNQQRLEKKHQIGGKKKEYPKLVIRDKWGGFQIVHSDS